MGKNRLEAFSDGVMAIIITIMVLEMKVPHGADFDALKPMLSVFLSYVLSFIYVGIYWNNHHHVLHAAQQVSSRVLWANMHLLFWVSLMPFVTGWMGENHFAALPTALYGTVLFCSGGAYFLLEHAIIATDGQHSPMARAVSQNRLKDHASLMIYAISIPLAFYSQRAAQACFVLVALMWLIPDRRIERALAEQPHTH